MSKNPLGKLSQRAVKAAPAASAPATASHATSESSGIVNGKRRRGASEVVSMTVRVRRQDWARLGELRLTHGKSAQEVFHEGLAMVFEQYGLEPPVAP